MALLLELDFSFFCSLRENKDFSTKYEFLFLKGILTFFLFLKKKFYFLVFLHIIFIFEINKIILLFLFNFFK